MEIEFVTDDMSEEDHFQVFDDIHNDQDISGYEEERCGICMDVVIDRGVLDCCQHWFCFACIDNWATITNLCPLCQNEFQLITCVPVYDTITTGSSKAEEDAFSRDDDWCIEGEKSSLSFPSYYIDENSVVCLEGDGCKIRSGTTVGDDLNYDTSIACDSCDTWYHAFCVGFDPENTTDSTWFCPRCVVCERPHGSVSTSVQRPSNQCGSDNSNGESSIEATFSRKVSVSVADVGETAVVVSMVGGDQWSTEPTVNFLSTPEVDMDQKSKLFTPMPGSSGSKVETSSEMSANTKSQLKAQELELSLSHDKSVILSCSTMPPNKGSKNCTDKGINKRSEAGGFKISTRESPSESFVGGISENRSSITLPLVERTVDDAVVGDVGITGVKRKHTSYSEDTFTHAEDIKASIETESAKKVKTMGNIQNISYSNQADKHESDDSQRGIRPTAANNDYKGRTNSEKKDDSSDIMSIVQGTGRRITVDKSSKEREAGLRVKKIMRRAVGDKESSIIVQKLREEIREAVRNNTSVDFGKKLVDPKLLAAFRTAVAGPVTEPARKVSDLVAKAKKSMLQKGKARENLTKKIYGLNGRRKRAWDRECEVEFWKHRCMRTTKPEKIETLNTVLDLLRSNSGDGEQHCELPTSNPILSRLYLADTSVFPRKDNIKPVAALKVTSSAEEHHVPGTNNLSTIVGVPLFDKDKNDCVPSIKGNATSCKVNPNKSSGKIPLSSSKVDTQKSVVVKSNGSKSDKRKWALEVLARKTAVAGKNCTQEKDGAVLKGNYLLLAQLPVNMRPVLASVRHNKVPLSIRQAQLYRLTEHLLRTANQSVIGRAGETELAIADAINIEKELANRSSSKLVYLNLCSQELLRYSSSSNNDKDVDMESKRSPPLAVCTNLSIDPDAEEALRTAGLISDSPPNSPCKEMNDSHGDNPLNKIEESSDKIFETDEKIKDDDAGDPTENKKEGHTNILEIDSRPELDIYGDFEYNLEDEDYIGVSGVTNVSKFQLEEESSRMKVVLSTLSCNKPNNALPSENIDGLGINDGLKNSTSLLKCSNAEGKTEESSRPLESLPCDGSEDPSFAEVEELYGPEKETSIELCPDASEKQYGQNGVEALSEGKAIDINENYASIQKVGASEVETEGYAENHVAATNHDATNGKNSPNSSQTSENVPRENQSIKDSIKRSGSASSISKKVEIYIKEHLRPLCKSGVITVEQYRWAVAKTTEKVMKFHSKDKSASFLIKEGEKVKKLAQQYVEAAQQDK